MKDLNFDFEFKMLPNTPHVVKRAYEVLADNLASASSNNISSIKAWQYANRLYERKELKDVSSEDVAILKKFIEEDLKPLPNFITAQLLDVIL